MGGWDSLKDVGSTFIGAYNMAMSAEEKRKKKEEENALHPLFKALTQPTVKLNPMEANPYVVE